MFTVHFIEFLHRSSNILLLFHLTLHSRYSPIKVITAVIPGNGVSTNTRGSSAKLWYWEKYVAVTYILSFSATFMHLIRISGDVINSYIDLSTAILRRLSYSVTTSLSLNWNIMMDKDMPHKVVSYYLLSYSTYFPVHMTS